jgi:hypothetical protein
MGMIIIMMVMQNPIIMMMVMEFMIIMVIVIHERIIMVIVIHERIIITMAFQEKNMAAIERQVIEEENHIVLAEAILIANMLIENQ